MTAVERLTEEEKYLFAILSDAVDIAEFSWEDHRNADRCFRAYPYQYNWWKCDDPMQIFQSSRSVGKSESFCVKLFGFPFLHPGQEALITAPELIHLEPITQLVETRFERTRLGREMMRKQPTHRPFLLEFHNGSRILGRIPQRDGRGVKGCVGADSLVLTKRGLVRADTVSTDDEVWSHELRWTKVAGVEIFEDDDCYLLRGFGGRNTIVNGQHRVYGRLNRNTPKQAKDLGPSRWLSVPEILDNPQPCYWSGCASFPAEEAIPVPPLVPTNGHCILWDQTLPAFWWLVGRWLADGYTTSQVLKDGGRGRGRVCYAVHPQDQEHILLQMKCVGLKPTIKKRDHSSADIIEVSSTSLAFWLEEHFGKLSHGKRIHPCVYFLGDDLRQAFLSGYLSGDGNHTFDRPRHRAGSASSELALAVGLLGQTFGMSASFSVSKINVTEIMGVKLKKPPRDSYRVGLGWNGRGVFRDGYVTNNIIGAAPMGRQTVVNIVSEDHSFLANGIFHHNTHPLWLLQDEASDYPPQGWTELIESLKRGTEGAMWLSAGVTRGVRDAFYEYSKHGQNDPPLRYISHKEDNAWTVHRVVAMARPNWTNEEREEKIKQYGSKDDPDFRRNIYGSHGDAQSPLFVQKRLLASVDDDPSTEYNTDEYWHFKIKDTELDHKQADILDLLDPPSAHRKYRTTWIGADIGYTNDPTEILIFAEVPLTADEKRESKARGKAVPVEGANRIKLIGRVTLLKITEPAQADVIEFLIDYYKPQAFSMDAGGNGLPLYQQIQRRMEDIADQEKSARSRRAAESIKPYKFDQKVVVEFDETVELPDNVTMEERIKEAGIERRVLEAATDVLRTYVDEGRFWLPWDLELIGEMMGQSYSYSKSELDRYGRRRRIFSQGNFHALDAMRFAMMGHKQFAIEALMATKAPEDAPVLDMAIPPGAFY